MDVSYESYTPERLKAEMLEILSGTVETREGSYANTLVSPVAYQLYKIYQLMPLIKLMAFPDETAGEFIDLRARDFGIKRVLGTKATVTLQFTTPMTSNAPNVPAGTVAGTEDGLQFVTLEDAAFTDQVALVEAEAVDIGRQYNVEPNTITVMAVNIAGVSAVTNPEAAVGGTDDEKDAALLQRYHDHLQRPISSGNKNHYAAWAKEVEGISHAETVSLWNGPGTVKVIVAGPDKDPVDETIIANCAAHIEQERPIGASVTVVTVAEKAVDVVASVTLIAGHTTDEVAEELTAALGGLMASFPFGTSNLLRYSRSLALLLDCEGVEEYHSFTLNGGTANITAEAEETLVVGTVTVTTA